MIRASLARPCLHPYARRERAGVTLGAPALGLALGLALGCQPSSVFQCSNDDDCTVSGIGGTCQSDGYCSFPSDECDSGQQYGQYAPPALAGTCVPVPGVGSSGETTDDTVAEVTGSPDDTGLPDEGEAGESSGPPPTTGPYTTGPSLTTGPETTGEVPADPDLRLWLTFDDLSDEIVYDQSEYGNDAYCYDGCPLPDDGIFGSSAYFSGQGSLLEVRFSDELATPEAFTLAAWVRPERLMGGPMAITELPFAAQANSNWNSWELRLGAPGGDTSHSLYFATANDELQSVIQLAPAPFEAGQWVHLVGTWDGDLLMLYLDGRLWEVTEGMIPGFDGHDLFIGGGLSSGMPDDWFEGNIDDLRLYARALEPDEIELLYQGGL